MKEKFEQALKDFVNFKITSEEFNEIRKQYRDYLLEKSNFDFTSDVIPF